MTQPRWRLVDGSSPAEGRLEYQSDEGDWVCVCGYSTYISRQHAFDDVCRELGFKQKMAFYDFSSTFLFGRCLGKVFMMVYTDGMSSAIPHIYCRSQDAIGLRCTNSKRIIHCLLNSVCQSVCLSVCLSCCLSVCLSVCLLVGLLVSLSVFLSVSLSARLSVCLSVCLYESNIVGWFVSL